MSPEDAAASGVMLFVVSFIDTIILSWLMHREHGSLLDLFSIDRARPARLAG